MSDTTRIQPRGSARTPGAAAFTGTMRRVLIVAGVGLAVLLPAGTVAGWLLGGAEVGVGVLLGLAIPAAFFGATVATGVLAARLGNTQFVAVVGGAWLVKIIILMVVMAVLRDADFYSRSAFFAAFVVGVAGWLAAELITVVRSRTPYVEVASSNESERGAQVSRTSPSEDARGA